MGGQGGEEYQQTEKDHLLYMSCTIAVTVWKIPTLKSQTSFYREMYRHVSDGMGLTFTSIFLSCLYIVRSYDDTPMSPYISTINRI